MDSEALTMIDGTCQMCKNGYYLWQGECYATCPGGLLAFGQGLFGRECVNVSEAPICGGRTLSSDGSACSCGINDCHRCHVYKGETLDCLGCKQMKYLYDNQCLTSCPEGYAEQGSGSFFRECRLIETCGGRQTI